ncbi:alanyl-tRNA synthetase [Metabacillus malikii]|uniref:Alanyl-tRNA synthetase n=1 Tax=Metabacillus malikii TaxID=1504265 RepID=A0ABT9ZLD6_9BACI|nr:alanyl-tRNA synthetase [Metabacillus malikii]
METRKLFYEDQYVRAFTTEVLKQDKDEQGRNYVTLAETAFYPTGGGQPHDIGTLNGVIVYDVEEVDKEIRHFVKSPIEVGAECDGEIEWSRRFDHMQQHAGQHILSAVFEDNFGYQTISFHLGKELCTIDLHVDKLTEDEIHTVEQLANDIIAKNLPIEAKWVSNEDLANYRLRKKLSVSENIRLVIIENVDYNGCGGTHPSSTGQVAMIKILGFEKQKGHIRLQFVCGNRVLKQLDEKHQVIQSLTTKLNAPQQQLAEAANRVLQHTKSLEKTVEDLRTELIEYKAEKYMLNAEALNNKKVIKAIIKNGTISELQQMARTIQAMADNTIMLFINEQEDKLQMVLAKTDDIENDMNQLIKQLLPLINGKGGGNKALAQGGGEKIMTATELMGQVVALVCH